MLFLHTLHKSVSAHVPIHFVCIGNEKGGEGLSGIPHRSIITAVGQQSGYFHRINHELAGDSACQSVQRTHAGDGEIDRSLISHRKAAVKIAHIVFRADGIPSSAYILSVISSFCLKFEAIHAFRIPGQLDFAINGI